MRKALKLDPQSTLMQIQLGLALLASRGKPPPSRSLAWPVARSGKTPSTGTKNPGAYRVLGQAYYRAGKLPESYAATAEAYFLAGNISSPVFAKRAQPGLRKGSPTWRRMDEIVTFKSRT